MEKKVELFKNTNVIKTELERCPEVCKAIQKLFNKLNSNGLSASFEAVIEIVTKYLFASRQTNFQNQSVYNGHKEMSDLIKNLAIDSNPENSKFMGFKMKREKLIDLMEIDEADTKELIDIIQSISIEDWILLQHLDFDAKTAKVNLKADHVQKIEESRTIYADNERQIKATAALLPLIDALNGYISACEYFDKPDNIDGLRLNGNKAYILDVARIKSL